MGQQKVPCTNLCKFYENSMNSMKTLTPLRVMLPLSFCLTFNDPQQTVQLQQQDSRHTQHTARSKPSLTQTDRGMRRLPSSLPLSLAPSTSPNQHAARWPSITTHVRVTAIDYISHCPIWDTRCARSALRGLLAQWQMAACWTSSRFNPHLVCCPAIRLSWQVGLDWEIQTTHSLLMLC